jgi:glycosyltransferase involved in cell wall biosynthesis
VISHALGDRAQGLGISRQSILYLPPGADPDSIRETSREAARERFGLDPSCQYVGYLGNIYQRDADLMFDTMKRLQNPNVKLLMVGDPGCRIDETVKDRVIVTGRVAFEDLLDYLSACDVLALPLSDTIANRGRWPSKLNEYVAVGRPTVGCDVGDVADLLRDHNIGLLVKPHADDFAEKINELLCDPARAQEMGDRAREVARTSYSQDAMAERLERYYMNLLAADPA